MNQKHLLTLTLSSNSISFVQLISYNSLSVIRIGIKDVPEKHFEFIIHQYI